MKEEWKIIGTVLGMVSTMTGTAIKIMTAGSDAH